MFRIPLVIFCLRVFFCLFVPLILISVRLNRFLLPLGSGTVLHDILIVLRLLLIGLAMAMLLIYLLWGRLNRLESVGRFFCTQSFESTTGPAHPVSATRLLLFNFFHGRLTTQTVFIIKQLIQVIFRIDGSKGIVLTGLGFGIRFQFVIEVWHAVFFVCFGRFGFFSQFSGVGGVTNTSVVFTITVFSFQQLIFFRNQLIFLINRSIYLVFSIQAVRLIVGNGLIIKTTVFIVLAVIKQRIEVLVIAIFE